MLYNTIVLLYAIIFMLCDTIGAKGNNGNTFIFSKLHYWLAIAVAHHN
jgi:hypothetical protein